MPPSKPSKITVLVQPNASGNSLVACKDGVWHIKIAAPPVEGRANRELLHFLSDLLGISQSRLGIEKGLTSRYKIIAVSGLTTEQAIRLLQRKLGQAQDMRGRDRRARG